MDREERDRLRAEINTGWMTYPATVRRLLDAAEARAEKAEERLRWAEAKASVYGGEWCSKNMAEGRGSCGACASCCRQVAYDRDEWKARAEKAEASNVCCQCEAVDLCVAEAALFAADEERDAMVERLRRAAERAIDRAHFVAANMLNDEADAIERGDHRKGGE